MFNVSIFCVWWSRGSMFVFVPLWLCDFSSFVYRYSTKCGRGFVDISRTQLLQRKAEFLEQPILVQSVFKVFSIVRHYVIIVPVIYFCSSFLDPLCL